MSAFELVDVSRDASGLIARFPTCEWLSELRVLDVRGDSGELRTPPGSESMLVVLDGTHDLAAGAGTWARRGVRRSPFDGRPVALYLPPATRYSLGAGDGRAAVWSVRQPEIEQPRADDALSQQPLLPLAGSQKAFDPVSKSWRPTESFPSSPEALLPRRIERIAHESGATTERIAGTDYKTLSLAVDELHVPAGASVELPAPHAYPAEVGALVMTEGEAELGEASIDETAVAAIRGPLRLTARIGRAYVLIAYAGRKGTG